MRKDGILGSEEGCSGIQWMSSMPPCHHFQGGGEECGRWSWPDLGSGLCSDTYWLCERKVGGARGSRRAGRPEGHLWEHTSSPQDEKLLTSGNEGPAGVREWGLLVVGGDFSPW